MAMVNVVIIPDIQTPGDPEMVKRYFNNPLFNILPSPTETDDLEVVKTILRQSGNNHTIIVKDSSVSNLTSDQIASYVTEAMAISVDLYYLSRWNDQCQMSKMVGPNFLRTYSPNGFQAIMFYPSAISKILQEVNDQTIEKILYTLIYNGILRAICNPQNVFYYDAWSYASNNTLFLRLNECSDTTIPDQVTETNRYLYIGGILILIFLVAWGMRKMGPTSKPNTEKEDDLVKTLTK